MTTPAKTHNRTHAAAVEMVGLGLSVLPVAGRDWVRTKGDGTTISLDKRPAVMNGRGPKPFEWLGLQTRIADTYQLAEWFEKTPNVGVICGAVSGNLEAIDFDGDGMYDAWRSLMEEYGQSELLAKLYVQSTRKEWGRHVVYRCADGVEAGRKLAERPIIREDGKPGRECLVETRGEGHYIVAAPSEGYTAVQGTWRSVPEVTAAERSVMLALAATLDLILPESEEEGAKSSPLPSDGGERPGDIFNRTATWEDVLRPEGWQLVKRTSRLTTWVRPGKKASDGISAVSGLGHHGNDLLRVHTTNGYPLNAESYSKFGAYAALKHRGDHHAAAVELRKQGYKAQTQTRKVEVAKSLPLALPGEPTVAPGAQEGPALFRRVRLSELMARPPRKEIVSGLFAAGDSCAIVGKRKSGKTFVLLDMLLCLAAGIGFAGGRFVPERPLTVVYCTTEGKGGMRNRIEAICHVRGIDIATIEDTFVYIEELPQLYDVADARYAGRFADALLPQLDASPDVLSLDTLAKSILGAEENSNAEMSQCLAALAKCRESLDKGCTSLLAHHTGRNDEIRGASALDGDLDLLLKQLWDDRPEGTDERKLTYAFAKDTRPFEDILVTLDPWGDTVVPSYDESGFLPGRGATVSDRLVLHLKSKPKGTKLWPRHFVNEMGLDRRIVHKALADYCPRPGAKIEAIYDAGKDTDPGYRLKEGV